MAPDAEEIARGDEACLSAGADKEQQQRPGELGAAGDVDHRAVGHEGGVERLHGVLCGRCRQAIVGRALGLGQTLGQRRECEPGQRGWCGQAGGIDAVDEHDTMRIKLGELLKGGVDLRARGRRAPGADRDGQGVLERRAQVGVLPGLEPAMR